MKKLTVLVLIIIGILSCSISKKVSYKRNSIGIKQKTSNPNTPYIYKNGYLNFEIIPVLTVREKDSTYINELRFNAVFSAMYTKKLMFDKFGKWDEEIRPNNKWHPILVWKKRKLFDNEDKTYSIAAYGVESMEEMYASVIVLDDENQDCLTETSTKKDSLTYYFSNGIINLNSSKKFYEVYREMGIEYNKKK